jgi:hypothetical protein
LFGFGLILVPGFPEGALVRECLRIYYPGLEAGDLLILSERVDTAVSMFGDNAPE